MHWLPSSLMGKHHIYGSLCLHVSMSKKLPKLAKKNLRDSRLAWSRGIRFFDKKGNNISQLVCEYMQKSLKITDSSYVQQFLPLYQKMFLSYHQKKLDNVKSKYRSDLCARGKCPQATVTMGTTHA
jgi:hypothetical protein